jgi:hypothetical protein
LWPCRFSDAPIASEKGGGSRKQQGRSTDGMLGLELEGREEGVRCTQQGRDAAQQLHAQLTAGVGVRTEERKSGSELYKRNPNGPGPNKYSPIN